jgi:hypothetical protein
MHKALFFIVLAGSFWLLASHSEKMWIFLESKIKDDKKLPKPAPTESNLDDLDHD